MQSDPTKRHYLMVERTHDQQLPMPSGYKRFLEDDVPVPARSAYRRRKKEADAAFPVEANAPSSDSVIPSDTGEDSIEVIMIIFRTRHSSRL